MHDVDSPLCWVMRDSISWSGRICSGTVVLPLLESVPTIELIIMFGTYSLSLHYNCQLAS